MEYFRGAPREARSVPWHHDTVSSVVRCRTRTTRLGSAGHAEGMLMATQADVRRIALSLPGPEGHDHLGPRSYSDEPRWANDHGQRCSGQLVGRHPEAGLPGAR